MQVYDAHNDLLTFLTNKKMIENYNSTQLKSNEVAKVFAAFFCNPKFEFTRDNIKLSQHLFSKLTDAFVPTLENIGYVTNTKQLQQIIDLKPLCVTLTWNYDNCLAGGAYGTSGLTEWGRTVIKTLEANQIFIDVSHLNRSSFYEFADLTIHPLLCSHSASAQVYDIPRNLNPDQIKIISQSNGYIGLCMYNTLLCNAKASFQTIFKHIDNILTYANTNTLGLGSDFNSTYEENPTGLKDYTGIQNLLNFINAEFGTQICENFAFRNLCTYLNTTKYTVKNKHL